MKILLIYPPPNPIQSSAQGLGLAPPLGILSLATLLLQKKHQVVVKDYSTEPFDLDELGSLLKHIDVVGLTALTYNLESVKTVIEFIKKRNCSITTIIGGPHPTMYPRKSLVDTKADFSVIGDAESSFPRLIEALEKNLDTNEIIGVCSAKNKNDDQIFPSVLEDIDTAPIPKRSLIKHLVYGKNYDPKIKAGEFTSITTSRGCPYNCRFCSRKALASGRFRSMSVGRILEELEDIKAQGFRYVAFTDDCMLANKKHAMQLFKEIMRRNLDLIFYITNARVDDADYELFVLMKKAGVLYIQFGLESANQDTLSFYKKSITVRDIVHAVKLSNSIGFITTGSFIFGAPNESIKHLKKTIGLAKSLPLESASFNPLKYVAGSQLWSEAVEQGKIKDFEYIVYADKNRNLGNFSQKELFFWCRKAEILFYLRPKFFYFLLRSALGKKNGSFVHSYLYFSVNQLKLKILGN